MDQLPPASDDPTGTSSPTTSAESGPGEDSHGRALAREFFASALYVAIVLLSALVALPKSSLPPDISVVATLFGTAIGLILAHFVAFRLAAHLTSETGFAPTPVAQEAVAGLGGGLLVAALAAIPYALWDSDDALGATLVALALLPALMGMAIARLRGRDWPTSLMAGGLAVALALLVVAVKYRLGH